MFSSISRQAIRYRYWVIALWGVLLVAGLLKMSPLAQFSMSTGFLSPGVESVDARQLIDEKFGGGDETASVANIIVHSPDGLQEEDLAYARGIAASVPTWSEQVTSVTNVFEQPELEPALTSEDGTTLLIPASLKDEAFGSDTMGAIKDIRAGLPEPPPGTEVYVSGDAGLGADHIKACLDAFDTTAIVALALITVILLFVYRSPLAPLVALFTIGAAAGASFGVLGLLMDSGVEFSSFVPQFLILIIFGAGSDYALFVVSRYREELAQGDGYEAAAIRTMARVGTVIASAALVVLIGFGVMAFSGFEMFRTLGPGIAIGVGVLLIAALTLIPALMTALPPRILFWPSRELTFGTTARRGLWGAIGHTVSTRPWTVLAVGAVLMAIPLGSVFFMNRTFEVINDLPDGYESVRGHRIVESRFPMSRLFPINVVLESPGNLRRPEGIAALAAVSDGLEGVAGVQEVMGPNRPLGEDMGLAPEAIAGDPGLAPILANFVSADGTTARLIVGSKYDPFDGKTLATIDRVRERLPALLAGADLRAERVLVGGASAEMEDLLQTADREFNLLMVYVAVAVFVVLALLLRSVVAPLYLLATIFLTYYASLGASTLLFQNIVDFRYPGVDWTVQLMLFFLMVVLAADYSILLMSRIREETGRRGVTAGVEIGVARTGGVISSAGLILAGTLGALMLTPLGSLIQMGFAVSFGVLLDTFVIRPFVQPAIARLLGRWGWWPGHVQVSPALAFEPAGGGES